MTYDLIIIGTGPGGYVCAIRAAQLGLTVAVIEKRATHGGTCLNVGCIPSKALLHATELLAESKHSFAKMGLIADTKVDFAKMMGFKQEAIDGNTKGIDFLFKKNKVEVIRGTGKILGAGKVEVDDKTYEAKSIVIATGSDSASTCRPLMTRGARPPAVAVGPAIPRSRTATIASCASSGPR